MERKCRLEKGESTHFFLTLLNDISGVRGRKKKQRISICIHLTQDPGYT